MAFEAERTRNIVMDMIIWLDHGFTFNEPSIKGLAMSLRISIELIILWR